MRKSERMQKIKEEKMSLPMIKKFMPMPPVKPPMDDCGGVFSYSGTLTDEEKENIKESFRRLHTGVKNMGGTIPPMPLIVKNCIAYGGPGKMKQCQIDKYSDLEIELLSGPEKDYSWLEEHMTERQLQVFLGIEPFPTRMVAE